MNAVIYSRFSTDRQDVRSLDDQVRRCRRYAEEHDVRVVGEYRDAATSGASLHRADMQKLLGEASKGTFRAVLVDDLSRLSRDLGDTWNLVFGTLAASRVKVIDCSTGMSSDGAGSRLTFGAMALVNDTFLQLVKSETHRGLEGRARAGFWTGGSCYGFRTELEKSVVTIGQQLPQRARMVVYEPEAEIVRRIFRERANGDALSTIARRLNEEKIPSPRESGWSKSLLHFMLRNERYVGRFTWNKREWFRDPVTKRRRCRRRPQSEWVVSSCNLMVIPADLWARVEALQAKRASKSDDIRPPTRHEHLLSGLLRCGVCGASMSIVSRAHKNGKSWSNYGCGAHFSKGDVFCSNRRTVSELKVDRELLVALQGYVASEKLEAWCRAGMARAQRKTVPSRHLEDLIRAQEKTVEKTADVLVRVGFSEALGSRLRAEEEKLRSLRAELAAASMPAKASCTPKYAAADVVALVRDLTTIARAAPGRAGRLLARLIRPIVLRPVLEGYEGLVSLIEEGPRAGGPVCDRGSCGGRHRTPPHTPDFAFLVPVGRSQASIRAEAM